jgi:uncharacterized OB-fold protein
VVNLPILPSPEITPESDVFWKAAAEEKLWVGHCNACAKSHWYPRAICPFCASADTGWRAVSGRGKIYSCSLVSPAKNPYVIAFVTLEEGPVLLTNVFAEDLAAVAIGQNVTVVFAAGEREMRIPVFVIAET